MEDLNNHQMILLTMLVAFVTSIATGIITVALLQEAPQTVTQTVNRVVERTIERVVTGSTTPEKQVKPTTITREVTKEVTVYAKEDDLLISAVEKNQSRMAQIYPKSASTTTPPIGIGFIVSRDGLVVTTSANLVIQGVSQSEYQLQIENKRYAATIVEIKESPKYLAFLRVDNVSEGTVFDAVSFGSNMNTKLGQTVVALGGDEGTSIFKTTLSKFNYAKSEGTSTAQTIESIEVTPKIPDGYNGSLIANLDGLVVGITVWNDLTSRYVIYPAAQLFDVIQTLSSKSPARQSVNDLPTTNS